MNNVVQLQTAIWTELKTECDLEKQDINNARARWPSIASRMAQLRKDYPSNNGFGHALQQHGIVYDADIQAAFIWMGSLKPEALEDAIDRSVRRSPRTFRMEVELWKDDYFKPISQACEIAEERVALPDLLDKPLPAQEIDIKPVLKTEKTVERDPSKMGPGSKLTKFGADAELLFAISKGGGRSEITKMVPAHNKFLYFVIDKLKAGVIHPKVTASNVMHAGTFINGLDKSLASEMVFSRAGKVSVKAMNMFMQHFDLLLVAERLGWDYNAFRQAINGKTPPAKTDTPSAWTQLPPQRQPGPLPAKVIMTCGIELHPEPIYVCGNLLYPSEAYPNLSYAEAHVLAHNCCQMGMVIEGSTKAIGMFISWQGLRMGRQFPEFGGFVSLIGTSIQSRGEGIEKRNWFKMEPYRNTTTSR